MGISQLGYVGIGVSDLPRWEQFAAEVLGLQVAARGDDGTLFLRMDEYAYRLALHPTGENDLLYLGWFVPSFDALDALGERLRAADVRVEEGSAEERAARRVRRLLTFRDPSGYRSELVCGPVRAGAPFAPGRPHAGFKAGPLGLGHLVLRVDDRPAAERFYRDVLGLRLSDYGSGPVAFFHCNPRHHSLGIADAAALPRPKRISHLLLEALTLDDVGIALDRCQQHGHPLTVTLGKHVNDHMVSFYMRGPSGFDVEIGWGAREVDDRTWFVESYDRGDVWGHRRIEVPAGAGA